LKSPDNFIKANFKIRIFIQISIIYCHSIKIKEIFSFIFELFYLNSPYTKRYYQILNNLNKRLFVHIGKCFFLSFYLALYSCVYSAKLFPFIQRNYFRLFSETISVYSAKLFPIIQRNYFRLFSETISDYSQF
jgi:hypothetical protein